MKKIKSLKLYIDNQLVISSLIPLTPEALASDDLSCAACGSHKIEIPFQITQYRMDGEAECLDVYQCKNCGVIYHVQYECEAHVTSWMVKNG